MVKAICLFSGGLDSILAVKLMQEQDIEVVGVFFDSPFYPRIDVKDIAKKLGIRLKIVKIGNDYFKILRKPKHGYGKYMNPCIDCRIYMLKKAWIIGKKLGASFIVTGEVVGERPMSQSLKTLRIIDKESKLEGLILRPLSAKFFPETIPEKKGMVEKEKLLNIKGRSRKKQLELAKKFGIDYYPSPSGGCLLTDKEYAKKVKDLLEHKKRLDMRDLELLRYGRHFRAGKNKIIVGRNKEENKKLLELKRKTDYIFEVVDAPGPVTILQGPKTKDAIKLAASITARYSDATRKNVVVKYGKKKPIRKINVSQCETNILNKLRL
ncbi:MAG: tRNA 4-thiouridine(8) synthase ThiI [Candidatus Aenigmatarchaeota archaeon]|nr:MAG: tRNA 4-thiouridine(8) synthase ThiI [Candidatus Aenigmarchaeota archaeon]